jgi:hypothetical protein
MWPLAFAFVGMCAAIAYVNAHAPLQEDPKVLCTKMRGEWSGWSGSCIFSKQAETKQ